MAAGLALIPSCVAPAASEVDQGECAAPITEPVSVPVDERARLEELAARLDLLRVLRSELDVLAKRDPDGARRTWTVSLQSFDEHLLEFLDQHPDLHPTSAGRLEQGILEPVEALRRAPQQSVPLDPGSD